MQNDKISVRYAEVSDHEKIVDYFLKADRDFLLGMGVDIQKLPARKEWLAILSENYSLPIDQKKFFYLIWFLNDQPIGHCNVNKIIPEEEAYMHLHMWQHNLRQKGLGVDLLKLTIPHFFKIFRLKNLYCEPMATNAGPNKALEKIGFDFMKSYETTPGWINFHQVVNRWCLSKERYFHLFSN
jgi:[ribosomal protein S5]-alanine N-acetyltransferase